MLNDEYRRLAQGIRSVRRPPGRCKSSGAMSSGELRSQPLLDREERIGDGVLAGYLAMHRQRSETKEPAPGDEGVARAILRWIEVITNGFAMGASLWWRLLQRVTFDRARQDVSVDPRQMSTRVLHRPSRPLSPISISAPFSPWWSWIPAATLDVQDRRVDGRISSHDQQVV